MRNQTPTMATAMALGRRAVGVATASAIALAAGCADEPTRPRDAVAVPAEAQQSLGLGAEERGQLRAALLFAGTQSMLALQQRDAGDQVAAAFAALAERVDADDRTGTERALVAARQAVKWYRGLAADDGSAAADLAAMDLTLERATVLATEARTARGDDATRPTPAAPMSHQERRP